MVGSEESKVVFTVSVFCWISVRWCRTRSTPRCARDNTWSLLLLGKVEELLCWNSTVGGCGAGAGLGCGVLGTGATVCC